MESIKLKEHEVTRIRKVIRIENYNPIDIFNLQIPFNSEDLKKQYFKIIRMIHPDKNVNNDRFNEIFNIVNKNYKILNDKRSKDICTKSLRLKKSEILKQFFNKQKEKDRKVAKTHSKEDVLYPEKQFQLIVYDPLIVSTHVIKNNIQKNNYKVKVNIAEDGAEHTKNKCKSKSDKHQKGLKQRIVQRKNAENRIKNHHFYFTNKVSIEAIDEYKDN